MTVCREKWVGVHKWRWTRTGAKDWMAKSAQEANDREWKKKTEMDYDKWWNTRLNLTTKSKRLLSALSVSQVNRHWATAMTMLPLLFILPPCCCCDSDNGWQRWWFSMLLFSASFAFSSLQFYHLLFLRLFGESVHWNIYEITSGALFSQWFLCGWLNKYMTMDLKMNKEAKKEHYILLCYEYYDPFFRIIFCFPFPFRSVCFAWDWLF